MEKVRENYFRIKDEIKEACIKAGRSEDSVTLIAVSKTHPVELIRSLYEIGERNFGENRVQELTGKIDLLPEDIRWHLIGHLQKNKVKYIVGKVELIHSVDSYELAEVIDRESKKRGVVTDILIEVNVAEENSKFGLSVGDTTELAKSISTLQNIRVKGLMTVAPFVEDPEMNRPVFKELRELSIDIDSKKFDNISMNVLSMGMTNDFKVAIEEGATCVRVGTAIFGNREYLI